MKKDYYTINDLAQITGLTDRTIRTYIKNGFLHGNKDGGIWMFTEEELGEFLAQDYVKQSIQTKAESIVREFILNMLLYIVINVSGVPYKNRRL